MAETAYLKESFLEKKRPILNDDETAKNELRSVNDDMRNMLAEFQKMFPLFIDTGYKIREAIFNTESNVAFFLCGSAVLVKLDLKNLKDIKKNEGPDSEEENRLKFLTIIIPYVNVTKLALNMSDNLIYLATVEGKIVEIDSNRLAVKKYIEIGTKKIGEIFFNAGEGLLYCLCGNHIFSVNPLTKETQSLNPYTLEGEKEKLIFFKFSLGDWLFSFKSGLVLRIDRSNEKFKIKFKNTATLLKYSRSGQKIIAVVSSEAYILNLDLSIETTLQFKEEILKMMMTDDEKYLIASTIEGKIILIESSTRQIITIPVHLGKIVYFLVDNDFKRMITFGHDSKIGFLDIPNLYDSISKKTNCTALVFEDNKSSILYIENSKSLKRWHFLENKIEELYEAEILCDTLFFIKKTQELVFCDTLFVKFFNPNTRMITREIPLKGKIILTSICVDDEAENVATLAKENNFIYVYNLIGQLSFQRLTGHSARITCQIFVPRKRILISGGNDNLIIKWQLATKSKIKPYMSHTQSITTLTLTRNHNKLISGSKDFTIKVWLLKTNQHLITLNLHQAPIFNLVVDKNNYLISASTDGSLMYWNLRSYSRVVHTRSASDINHFDIDNDNQYVAMTSTNELRVMKYSLNSKGYAVLGPEMNEKYEYISYIMKVLKGEKIKYEPKWDDWAIMPKLYTTLYLYCYSNRYRELRQCIKNYCQIAPAIKTNCFSIIIRKNYQRCLRVLFDSAKIYLSNNMYTICFIDENVMIEMNKSGHNLLHKFYDYIFKKYDSEDFPKFSEKSELPKYVFSTTLTPIASNFFNSSNTHENLRASENLLKTDLKIIDRVSETELDENLKSAESPEKSLVPLVLYVSCIRMNFQDGSPSSQRFIQSLVHCANKEIFRSKFIQCLLKSKWEKLKKWHYLQAIVYFVYIFILSLYLISRFYDEDAGVITIMTFVLSLSIYDLYQFCRSPKVFFEDFWNYIDLFRLISFIVYVILYYYNVDSRTEAITIITVISLMRGLSFFRLFDDTRYIIQLLLSVAKGMKSFAILLLYSTVSFSLVFMVQKELDNESTFVDYFRNSLLLNIGGANFTQNGLVDWIVYLAAVVFNVIIMMNMLIAIMGETFNDVRENIELADFIEIAQMIVEVETLYPLKKQNTDGTSEDRKTYFQVCEAESTLDKTDELSKDIKSMKKMLKKICEKNHIEIVN